jgi:hypothetical protein
MIKHPVNIRRAISEGSTIEGVCRVFAYSLDTIDMDRVQKVAVSDHTQYRSPCPFHTRCSGHLAEHGSGTILMPQHAAKGAGALSNEYSKSAKSVCDNHLSTEVYNDRCNKQLLSKKGMIRHEIIGGVVDGSLRSVIVCCWDLAANEIAIPAHVAANMRYPVIHPRRPTQRLVNDTAGIRYKALEAGDTVLVVRPPTLWQGSAQLMKVVIWSDTALGFSPYNCSYYNADFDGDEVQVYPVWEGTNDQAYGTWSLPNDESLSIAGHESSIPGYTVQSHDEHSRTFMMHTTLSIQDIISGVAPSSMAQMAGMKKTMCRMLSNYSSHSPSPDDIHDPMSMYNNTRSAIKDVTAQQLKQSSIGKTTRSARCGVLSADHYTGDELAVSVTPTLVDGLWKQSERLKHQYTGSARQASMGMPCLRAVQALSKVAQQAALNAHKATEFKVSRHDMVHALMESTEDTLVITKGRPTVPTVWTMGAGKGLFVSIAAWPHMLRHTGQMVGCHHPMLLRTMSRDAAIQSCIIALKFIYKYYGVLCLESDLVALAVFLAEYSSDGVSPLCGRSKGLTCFKWLYTCIGLHTGKLASMDKEVLARPHCVNSLLEAVVFCSFTYVTI